jgi:hypothetical protein
VLTGKLAGLLIAGGKLRLFLFAGYIERGLLRAVAKYYIAYWGTLFGGGLVLATRKPRIFYLDSIPIGLGGFSNGY